MTWAPDVVRWRDGDRETVFSALTGRGVPLHRETIDAIDAGRPHPAVVRRLVDLGILTDGADPTPGAWFPVRMRGAIGLVDAGLIWHPDPARPGHGGFAYRGTPASPEALAVFAICDGQRTLGAIADATGLPLATVTATVATWTRPSIQAVQLRRRRVRRTDPSLDRPLAPPRPPHPRTPDQVTDGATTLATYHLDGIVDPATHFDDRETTIAHALAVPHPTLGGVAYGARLRQVLGPGPDDLVVEVGCGTGELAAAFSPGLRYVRVDLSPALLRGQAAVAPGTHGVLGDAMALPLRDGCVDLLVSNEVLADLTSVPHAPGDDDDVGRLLRRYGLTPWPGRTRYNVGAWRFVAEIARVLRPGGRAWVSEFGTLDQPPAETEHLDHPEVSIAFDALAAVARHHGLDTELRPLAVWLHADLTAPHLARASWHAVRARARARGLHLPARSWTPARLQEALGERVVGLAWVPASEPGPGPLLTRFWGLSLTRRR